MAITKEDVIELMNERLMKIDKEIPVDESLAPVYHALISSIIDVVNAEIAAVRKLIHAEIESIRLSPIERF